MSWASTGTFIGKTARQIKGGRSKGPGQIKGGRTKMLKSRLPNILTYLKHGITNAASESLNAKIHG